MLYKSLSKITFLSIVMIICLTISTTLLATDWNDWIFYDNKYLEGNPEYFLPISVQTNRTLTIVPFILFIMASLASLWEINKITDSKIKKHYFLTGGLFVWLILPYTFYLAHTTKSFSEFWKYLKTKKEGNEQINFYKWVKSFKNNKLDKLFWNTTLFMFLILIVIVDFSLIWLHKSYDPGDTNSNIIFNTFSYFTQLTNFAVIIFVCIFSFAHQTITFKNNTLLILMAAYITVVGVIFWSYLLPFGNFKNEYDHIPTFVKTVWLHAVTPIFFAIFAINSLVVSKEKPNQFLHISIIGSIYPLFYAFFSYSLPFYTRHSVYGIVTNLNPNMADFTTQLKGNPLNFLFFFAISGTFYLFFFVFWKIADFIYKRNLKVTENKTKILI